MNSLLIATRENHGIRIKVFADDVKMYLTIVNEVDFHKLQLCICIDVLLCPITKQWHE